MAISAEHQVDIRVNKLTKAIYAELSAAGKIDPDQFYLLTDDQAGGEAVWGGIAGDIADQSDLQSALGGKADLTALNGYATRQWVEDKNYLTAHQSLADYATKQWVDDKNYLTAHQSLDAYARKANVNVSYSSSTHKITLDADGHTSEIDATDFIKDGMVESARYDAAAKKIVITFNTDAGKSPISVDVAAMVHEYTAGTGLALDGSQFSIDSTVAQKSWVEGKGYALSADIGDATVTINQGGVQKGRFTLNQKGNVTVDLSAGGSDAVWGNIAGDLTAQTDLSAELDGRYTVIATWRE